jgi:hypothetical protein
MLKVSSVSRLKKPERSGEAGAAKLKKPRVELNLREAEMGGEELPYLYYWALIRMHRKCFGRSGFAVAGLVR